MPTVKYLVQTKKSSLQAASSDDQGSALERLQWFLWYFHMIINLKSRPFKMLILSWKLQLLMDGVLDTNAKAVRMLNLQKFRQATQNQTNSGYISLGRANKPVFPAQVRSKHESRKLFSYRSNANMAMTPSTSTTAPARDMNGVLFMMG